MSAYYYPPTLYANSLIARSVLGKGEAVPAAYSFERQLNPEILGLYDSFGAPCELSWGSCADHWERARAWIAEEFDPVRDKEALLDLELSGLPVGVLIYDTYLRDHLAATADFSDPRLRKCAEEAAVITFMTEDYFDRHDVLAVFPDHMVYNKSGIVAQLAWNRGVPVFMPRLHEPFYLYHLPEKKEGKVALQVPYHHPLDRYPEYFAELPPARQFAARKGAREALAAQLSGQRKDLIFGGFSAYGSASGERVFEPNDKAKVLVMLHDFCDAPHVFGKWLFADFYEWIHHLLQEASKTDFQWAVKPHPNLRHWSNSPMGRANLRVIDELKAAYPHVRFLDPETSNLQLVEEGLNAMFTVYGTAGHEFAYLGVPVVNAGANPHMSYDFNLHPKSVVEYDECIRHADRLEVAMDKSKIEELYYMYRTFLSEEYGAPFEILPSHVLGSEESRKRLQDRAMLHECLANETPALLKDFDEYLEKTFNAAARKGRGEMAHIQNHV